MIFMDPTVASNWTVGTLVTEDTPSLKVSAPSPWWLSSLAATAARARSASVWTSPYKAFVSAAGFLQPIRLRQIAYVTDYYAIPLKYTAAAQCRKGILMIFIVCYVISKIPSRQVPYRDLSRRSRYALGRLSPPD